MKLFELFGDIFIDDKDALKSIDKMDKSAGGLGAKFGKTGKAIGKGMLIGTAAIGAAGAAMFGFAKKAADATDTIDKNSQKIGVSRKAYQELDFVLSQNGTSVDGLQTGMKTLSKAAYEASQGVTTYTDTFDALGISVVDSNGEMKKQEDLLYDTIRALQGMENETERTALASELLGKSATELAPLLNSGAASFDELTAKAHELGLVLGDEAIDAGVQFTDTMDQLKRSFSTAFTTIGVQFIPLIERFAEWIIANMPVIQATFEVVFDAISKVVKTLFEWFDIHLLPILQEMYAWIVENWATISEVFTTVFEIVGDVIMVAIGIIEKLFHSLAEILFPAFKNIYNWIVENWATISEVFTTVFDIISGVIVIVVGIIVDLLNILYDVYGYVFGTFVKIKDKFVKIFDGISDAIETTFGWITDFIDGIKDAYDAVKDFLGLEGSGKSSGGAYSPTDYLAGSSGSNSRGGSMYQTNTYNTKLDADQMTDILNISNQELSFDLGVS